MTIQDSLQHPWIKASCFLRLGFSSFLRDWCEHLWVVLECELTTGPIIVRQRGRQPCVPVITEGEK